ncbi:FmdB family zinc ribbon protein [Thermodesulfatator autotrophicus]|uniref:Phosphohydrolase n=1 Tax=Thermodesulfatator autotrophicus TaxID=1795632 RepID=A0A177E854_9BACT|nr:hypothetical protein [Thermodesulfatator autotrophicus]OAG27876.1 hypothetical protein TH606_04390 [Thermodesulfatator autotrophicus]
MKCPGQDTRYWKEDAIFEVKCPDCGEVVEFFKDDTSRVCPGCGKRLPNPRLDFGCAAYCPYAEQCLGSLPPELLEKQKGIFKDRIETEVLNRLKGQEEVIKRLQLRLKFAEQIALEEGANLPVVLASACLIELKEEAETLLTALKVPSTFKEEIIKTLHHEDSLESKVLSDAHLLSLISEGESQSSFNFQTQTGERLGERFCKV